MLLVGFAEVVPVRQKLPCTFAAPAKSTHVAVRRGHSGPKRTGLPVTVVIRQFFSQQHRFRAAISSNAVSRLRAYCFRRASDTGIEGSESSIDFSRDEFEAALLVPNLS
jgi:hypothetical protein